MTIERVVSSDVRRELDKQESAELYLIFLTLTHPSLPEPIRVVSDPENFVLDGALYQGFDFEISILSDGEQMPRAQLSVQNVDRIIGQAIFAANDPVRVDIQIIAGSEFDLSVFPRVAKNTQVVDLFNGLNGAFFDIQPGNAFQDIAMTIPAVADGDPVNALLDVSGNGNHAKYNQGIVPTLRTDGARWWIEGVSANSRLRINWTDGGYSQNTLMAAARWNGLTISSTEASLLRSYNGTSPGAGSILFFGSAAPNTTLRYLARRLDVSVQVVNPQTLNIGQDYQFDGGWNGSSIYAGVDGAETSVAELNYTASNFTDLMQTFSGRIYTAAAFYKALNASEKSTVRAFMRQRAGIDGASSVERMYRARHLYLTEVEGNVFTITGTLRSWDYTQETWPGIRATSTRMPGLYW